MKTTLSIAALAAFTISPAQDVPKTAPQGDVTKPAQTPQANAPDYCSVSKVLGCKVDLRPNAEARREAAEEGERAKRPEGKIDDVLVDSRDGSLDYAVLSIGGFVGIGDRTIAVPASALRWNGATEHFELDATEESLKALPAFDLGKARKGNLDDALKSVDDQWRTSVAKVEVKTDPKTGETDVEVRDASGRKIKDDNGNGHGRTLAGTTFVIVPTRLATLSDLDDYAVWSCNEKFGKVTDLLVDRNSMNVALAIVKRGGALGLGGTEYLVPFRATHLCRSGDDTILCINCETKAIETAIVYEKPKHGVVDPEAAKRALENDKLMRRDLDGNGHDKGKDHGK